MARTNSENDSDSDSDIITTSDNKSDGETLSTDKSEDEIDPLTDFDQIELCYLKKINDFFKKECSKKNIEKMIDIIEGNTKTNISLRILDWFVTKYSKKRIDCGMSKNSEIFDVRISYKSQLRSYKKRYFDPFRRRLKFRYYFGKAVGNKNIKTTLGQLNFFKWALSNNIINYVEENLKQISKEMNKSTKEEKIIKLNKKTKDQKSEEKKPKKEKKAKNSGSLKMRTTRTIENDEDQILLTFN